MDIRITPFSKFTALTPLKIKPSTKNNDNIFVVSQTKIKQAEFDKSQFNKTQHSIKQSSNIIQPKALVDKKGILLYQQIERNNLFSNNSELTNRFYFKV